MNPRYLLLATALLFPAQPSAHAGKSDRTLDIYLIDSEGGGSTLMVTPDGESILMDSGNPGGRDPARIHKVATEVAGLKQIDHLVVTHFHIDHFGGAAELSKLIPVRNVHDKGIPESNPDNNPGDTRFPLLIKPYREMAVEKRSVLKPDATVPLRPIPGGPALALRCIAANQAVVAPPPDAKPNPLCAQAVERPKDMSDNANSVVTLLEFGRFRFFHGGDLTWNTEASLVCPVNRVGTVDVYQVNHHGLGVSNNPLLIQALAPTVSLMNNGPRKGGDTNTFAALKGCASLQAMYQVHRNVATSDAANAPADHIANHDEKCQAHYLKLSVAPDGASYTVSVPSTGHQRTFTTRSR